MREQPKGDEDIDPHYVPMLKVSLETLVIPITNVDRFSIPVPRRLNQPVLHYFRGMALVVICRTDSTLP